MQAVGGAESGAIGGEGGGCLLGVDGLERVLPRRRYKEGKRWKDSRLGAGHRAGARLCAPPPPPAFWRRESKGWRLVLCSRTPSLSYYHLALARYCCVVRPPPSRCRCDFCLSSPLCPGVSGYRSRRVRFFFMPKNDKKKHKIGAARRERRRRGRGSCCCS